MQQVETDPAHGGFHWCKCTPVGLVVEPIGSPYCQHDECNRDLQRMSFLLRRNQVTRIGTTQEDICGSVPRDRTHWLRPCVGVYRCRLMGGEKNVIERAVA